LLVGSIFFYLHQPTLTSSLEPGEVAGSSTKSRLVTTTTTTTTMDHTNNNKSADSVHIEDSASENNAKDASPKQRMGDVKLLQNNGETVLVPTPSPDPNGE